MILQENIMSTWGIILAAGSGSRLAEAGLSCPKQFISFKGRPLFWHSARTMARLPELRGLVFVFPPFTEQGQREEYERQLDELFFQDNIALQWILAEGGDSRQESAWAGLQVLPPDCARVLIHDSARPFASAALMARISSALESCHAVIPGVAVTDTIKQVNEELIVSHTPERKALYAVQTPQGFTVSLLKRAHARARDEGLAVTDDAMLMEHMGVSVLVTQGEVENIKITRPEDLGLLTDMDEKIPCHTVTGFGYDVHQYGGERPFMLGGVPIQTDIRIRAHSDGDVLLHALCDAILGCLGSGAGDIGTLFPDSDPAYDNYPSGALLSDVMRLAAQRQVRIVHADLTVIAQVPKIAPHRYSIAKNVASLLHLPSDSVSVKATTEEKMGFTGEKKGIKAVAVVTAIKRQPVKLLIRYNCILRTPR